MKETGDYELTGLQMVYLDHMRERRIREEHAADPYLDLLNEFIRSCRGEVDEDGMVHFFPIEESEE